MAHECDFSPRVTLVAIDKAFKRSPQEGLQAIGLELDNLKTRVEEIFWPKGADFKVDFKEKNGRLFWKRYTRPVVHCLMRGISLLKHDGADPEKIRQEEVVLEVFKLLEPQLLELKNGEAIQSLALRDINPTAGVSFVQFEKKNGRLIGRYKLLPFEELDQIAKFTNLIEERGDKLDLGIELEEGLSPLLTWVVKGRAINFKKELPKIVERTMESVVPELVIERPVEMRPWRTWEWMRPELSLLTPESIRQRGSADVHLGSVHGEVSVTEVPVYALPVVVADVQPYPRGGVEVVAEKIVVPTVTRMIPVNEVIEDTVSHLRGVIKEEVIAPQVTLPRYEDITISDVHLGSVHEDAAVVLSDSVNWAKTHGIPQAEKFVSRFARNKPAEYQGRESVKIEEVITENTEVIEGTEEVVVPTMTRMIPVSEEAAEVTVTELPRYEEVTVSDVHLGSVHGPKAQRTTVFSAVSDNDSVDSVIEEVSGIGRDGAIKDEHLDRREITEDTEVKQKAQKRKFSAFNYDSVVSVIKEMFNEQVIEHKRYQSVKAKVIGLQRQIANVVADQLIGRVSDTDLGWLVHGLALMRFDGIKEKQEMRRFRLSPVRAWADRVTKVAKRVKDKFVRISLGAYRHLFATA